MSRAAPRAGGFTLVEAAVVVAMMAAILSTIGVGLRFGHVANRENQQKEQLTRVGSELMERLFHVPFGATSDEPATAAQLNELFDGDGDLGTATLCSLRVPAGKPGLRFELANFPFGGEFEVRVDNDLDGDGRISGGREGRGDLFRIEILHDGKPILESIRAAPPTSS
jgi:hypothetical protein